MKPTKTAELPRVLLIGGTHYSQPLDETSRKKFQALSEIALVSMIAFSKDWRLRMFTEHAHFCLLPKLGFRLLRHIEKLLMIPTALRLILTRNAQILVAESPVEGFLGVIIKAIVGIFGKKIKLVIENHGDFQSTRIILLPVLRFACRQADALRCVSNFTRNIAQDLAPGKPVIQFPAWTDMTPFLEKNKTLAQRKPIVIFAGDLIPLKGIHFLLDAFSIVQRQIPESRLRIIGKELDAHYALRLRKQIQTLGLSGKISFAGFLPQSQLAQEIRDARMLVLPSLSEGLGRVLVEAMSCETPVVASAVGGIPELVQEGKTGFLVPPSNATILASRILKLLTSPELSEAMGKQGRKIAQQFFSEQNYVNHYRNFLCLLTGETSHAPSLVESGG